MDGIWNLWDCSISAQPICIRDAAAKGPCAGKRRLPAIGERGRDLFDLTEQRRCRKNLSLRPSDRYHSEENDSCDTGTVSDQESIGQTGAKNAEKRIASAIEASCRLRNRNPFL